MNNLEMFSVVNVVPVLMDSFLGHDKVSPECSLLCSNRFSGFPLRRRVHRLHVSIGHPSFSPMGLQPLGQPTTTLAMPSVQAFRSMRASMLLIPVV